MHSDKTLRENVKRKTPVYTDKTLGQENKEEDEGEGGDEEIERENMYSELELMNELGLSLSNCNFLVGWNGKRTMDFNCKTVIYVM